MDFQIDFIFKSGASCDDLVARIKDNPQYIFEIKVQDSIDKRTTRAKETGWVKIRHKNKHHKGTIKLTKSDGVCRASVSDQSGGMKLIGAWASWLASNACDLISGLGIRFE
jgi:hypothetical protein